MDTGAMGKYQLFHTQSGQRGAIMTKTAQTRAPFWLFYFNVDAIDAAADRVKAAGGQIVNGPTPVPGDRWIVQVLDPRGAIFALLAPTR